MNTDAMDEYAEKTFHGYTPENDEEREFLQSYDPSKFPIFTLTVDMVVFSEDFGTDHVLLILRRNFPYRNKWALPGGFINPDERAQEAAARELQEEAGLDLTDSPVVLVGAADRPDRDPRGRCVSLIFSTRVPQRPDVYAGDDAVEALWWPLDKIKNLDMAFDHRDQIEAARYLVRRRVNA